MPSALHGVSRSREHVWGSVLGLAVALASALSELTAKGRREGTFPSLHESVRGIVRPAAWESPEELLEAAAEQYRRDRTEGQEHTIILGVEKRAQGDYLSSWFEDKGLPVVAMAGYSSQTLVDRVLHFIDQQERAPVLLYAGDFDPSGEDMLRDLGSRLDIEIVRVALTPEQVEAFELPKMMGKATDARAAGFALRHGGLFQVELEALPAAELHRLYDEALADFWDEDAHTVVLEQEAREREQLRDAIDTLGR